MSDQFPIPGTVIPANTPVSTSGFRGRIGLKGERGTPGTQGLPGPIGNYNLTDAPFTVPEPGATVLVRMQDASWASPGQTIYVEWSGENADSAVFLVTAVNDRDLTLLTPLATALGAPWAQPFRYLTEETILTPEDNGWYLLCFGGDWTLHLPVPALDLFYFIRNDTDIRPTDAVMGTGIITLLPASGQIDDQAFLRLYPGEACRLFTDGSDWRSLGLSTLPLFIGEPSDPAKDLILTKLRPAEPCLSWHRRDTNRRTLFGDNWLSFMQGDDPDNPEAEARIDLSNDGRLELDKPTRIGGQLTVASGGAHMTGGLTVASGGANITGAPTFTSATWFNLNNTSIQGILFNVHYDGSSTYKEMLQCNPGWNNCMVRGWHYHGHFVSLSLMVGPSQRYDVRWDAHILRGSDGATAHWVASDAAMKRDIGPWEADALELLRKIPIQAYTQIKDGIRRAIGWVAQSVEKVVPDWVQETKTAGLDGNPIVRKRVEPNDQGLPYLIRAIQQLDGRLTRIDERLNQLEQLKHE